MRNILFDEMPEAITVNGILFELNTDFRIWLKVGRLMQKLEAAVDDEKNDIFLDICDLAVYKYPDQGYVLGDELLYGLMDFYKGFPEAENERARKKRENGSDKKKPPSFNFEFDSKYIYCSFVSFYGIRLQEVEYMHWWEFLTLFEGLMMSDQTSVNFVVGARQQEIKGKMPKEEKERLKRLKEQFALPEDEKTQKAQSNLSDILGKKTGK